MEGAVADRHWADGDHVPPAVRLAFDLVWDHLVVEDPPRPTDAIFCFGSRHRRVPERAAALHAAGVAPLVVVTGGPECRGDLPEAVRFGEEMVAAGIPRDRVILEARARNTGENVVLGMRALRRHVDPHSLTLVCWPLAARRCQATFGVRFPDLEVTSAPALPRSGVRWSPTNRRIRDALGELDRIRRYGEAGMIVPQPALRPLGDAADVLRTHLAATWASADDPPLVQVEAARTRTEAEQSALRLGEL